MSDDDELSEQQVISFLEDPKALLLLARIDRENGNIKTELMDEVGVSGKTMTQLLEEAEENGLIEEGKRLPGDHGRSKRYKLTSNGRYIQTCIQKTDLEEVYEELMEKQQEFEKTVTQIIEFVRAEPFPSPHQTAPPDPEDLPDEIYEIDQLDTHAESESEDTLDDERGHFATEQPDSEVPIVTPEEDEEAEDKTGN